MWYHLRSAFSKDRNLGLKFTQLRIVVAGFAILQINSPLRKTLGDEDEVSGWTRRDDLGSFLIASRAKGALETLQEREPRVLCSSLMRHFYLSQIWCIFLLPPHIYNIGCEEDQSRQPESMIKLKSYSYSLLIIGSCFTASLLRVIILVTL